MPSSGVIFLGGHPNLTKKLQQKYPRWLFISDNQLKRSKVINSNIVFYWTGYGSHKLMRYVYSKLPDHIAIHYVTATNIALLEQEMKSGFLHIRQKACA